MRENLTFIGAGIAGVITHVVVQLLVGNPVYGGVSPGWIRVVTGMVFFGVLILVGGKALRTKQESESRAPLREGDFTPNPTPQDTASDMARIFAGVSDDESRRRAIRGWLSTVPKISVLIPFVFYLRFGFIGPLGWGLTVFFDVYCLLWALGLYFLPRTEYHTKVPMRGDWRDRVGAFWLVACAFGPLFGWFFTEALPITLGSWHWLYGLRAFFAAGIPIFISLFLLRYVRGKAALVSLPLLIIITLIPVSTAISVIQDLWDGPSVRQVQDSPGGLSEFYLVHSERRIEGVP